MIVRTITIVIYCRLGHKQASCKLWIKFLAIHMSLMVANVMESRSTHYKCYWSTFKQRNIQILMVLHNYDCGKVDISIMIMKTTSRLFSQSQKSPSPTFYITYRIPGRDLVSQQWLSCYLMQSFVCVEWQNKSHQLISLHLHLCWSHRG